MSSGIEVRGGLRPSKMSVCEVSVVSDSSIVASEATRNDDAECSCLCVKIRMQIC